MSRLRAALQKRFKDRADDIKVHTPRNCEPLYLTFQGDRTAKIIGSLAKNPPKPNSTLSGLLVSKDFAYTVLDPADLADFTGLNMSTIIQRQRVALHVGWDMVRWHLEGMFGKIQEGVDLEDHRTIRVMDVVDIKQSGKHQLTLEWVSSIPSDMVADAAVALLLGISSSRASVKLTTRPHSHSHHDLEAKEEDTETEEQPPSEPHPYSHAAEESGAVDAAADKYRVEIAAAAHILSRTETLVALLEAQIGTVEECEVGESVTIKQEEKPDGDAPMAGVNEDEEGGYQNPRQDALRAIKEIGGPRRHALLIWLDDTCAAIEVETLVSTPDHNYFEHN